MKRHGKHRFEIVAVRTVRIHHCAPNSMGSRQRVHCAFAHVWRLAPWRQGRQTIRCHIICTSIPEVKVNIHCANISRAIHTNARHHSPQVIHLNASHRHVVHHFCKVQEIMDSCKVQEILHFCKVQEILDFCKVRVILDFCKVQEILTLCKV